MNTVQINNSVLIFSHHISRIFDSEIYMGKKFENTKR
jgi:hypothetical protein